KRLLSTNRLATLTGPGGIGKTRLAIHVGAEIAGEFRDGVWLVELAALTDPALVPQAVASVLHVREQPGRPLAAALSDYLQDRDLLLLLDNCEHLSGACAHLTDLLLRACPRLRILTTSQEPLRIAGEFIWRVQPLPLPDLRRLPPLEHLAQTEAVQLFCDRAAAVRAGFTLTEQNARWVAQICHLLDGIPLAIQLAAARANVLSVEQISARLEDALGLLTRGSSTILPRHQTLRGAMDWSYDLLLPPERKLLRRLSVFAGGFTLEAAEAICAGDGIESGHVLELLTQLVERSLVMADIQGPTARYRPLETLRQYAREKLREAWEDEATRSGHRDWFLNLALHAEPGLRGSDERWFDLLEAEHDNLRAALEFSLLAGACEKGLRLAAALRLFWQVRGYWTEGRQWLEMLLAAGSGTPPAVRAKALNAAGQFAQQQGDYERAKALSGESLDLYRTLRDSQGMAAALNVLGNVMLEQGDFRGARPLHEESLTYAREVGDPHLMASSLVNLANIADHEGEFDRAGALGTESLTVFRQTGDKRGIAAALHLLGIVAGDQGDFVAAQARFEESLAQRQELGDKRGIAASLSALGRIAGEQGDHASARAYYEQGLAIRRELGDRRGIAAALYSLGVIAWQQREPLRAAALIEESLVMRNAQGNLSGVAECLEGLARVTPDPQRTVQLLGAAEARREAIGTPLPPAERLEHERTVLDARRVLGESAFTSAWNQGRTLPMEQLIQYARYLGGSISLREH
ncbi:MAG: ATP-binding protein, partial [bacterium]